MYWLNFKHILLHKWLVWLECIKEGLYWQGLVHDLSKFMPAEFKAYAHKFYYECKEKSKLAGYTTDFKYAWLHHQHHSKHHWNHWIVDQNKKEALIMPLIYVLEMICDWRAMGKEFGDTALSFYTKNKDKMILAPVTRAFIESILNREE